MRMRKSSRQNDELGTLATWIIDVGCLLLFDESLLTFLGPLVEDGDDLEVRDMRVRSTEEDDRLLLEIGAS